MLLRRYVFFTFLGKYGLVVGFFDTHSIIFHGRLYKFKMPVLSIKAGS